MFSTNGTTIYTFDKRWVDKLGSIRYGVLIFLVGGPCIFVREMHGPHTEESSTPYRKQPTYTLHLLSCIPSVVNACLLVGHGKRRGKQTRYRVVINKCLGQAHSMSTLMNTEVILA